MTLSAEEPRVLGWKDNVMNVIYSKDLRLGQAK